MLSSGVRSCRAKTRTSKVCPFFAEKTQQSMSPGGSMTPFRAAGAVKGVACWASLLGSFSSTFSKGERRNGLGDGAMPWPSWAQAAKAGWGGVLAKRVGGSVSFCAERAARGADIGHVDRLPELAAGRDKWPAGGGTCRRAGDSGSGRSPRRHFRGPGSRRCRRGGRSPSRRSPAASSGVSSAAASTKRLVSMIATDGSKNDSPSRRPSTSTLSRWPFLASTA